VPWTARSVTLHRSFATPPLKLTLPQPNTKPAQTKASHLNDPAVYGVPTIAISEKSFIFCVFSVWMEMVYHMEFGDDQMRDYLFYGYHLW
jgi:hypothetical protein